MSGEGRSGTFLTPSLVRRGKALALAVLVSFACGYDAHASATPESGSRTVEVVDLRTEHRTDPMGIDTSAPRLSWQLRSQRRGVRQVAYQIRVATTEEALGRGIGLVMDSNQSPGGQSIDLPYNGQALLSRQRYYWQVRVWDEAGIVSEWSKPASWEMGLLNTTDWSAEWISPAPSSSNDALVRRSFRLRSAIKRARVYATARGLYQLFVNGQRAADWELTPGWTSYHKRLQYQIYDVTTQLHPGDNAIGAMLGEGWYSGVIGFPGQSHYYGARSGFLMQLEVTYLDGTTERIATDGGWRSGASPVTMSGIYAGESYDARLEQPGWDQPHFDDRSWLPVQTTAGTTAALIAQQGPPVRKLATITPQKVFRTPSGKTVVDMGQNMVGWVRLSVKGRAGTVVTLHHAEVLDQKGELYTDNLRSADATDQYVLRGNGTEVYEPRFTFHGFRYVAVEGYPGELAPESIAGIVVHSDVGEAGQFASSNPLLNQLQHNIVWGQRGNFIDVPTDCPQRDERLGWTGDAQVFAPTAAFNADVENFFEKWLQDLAADQFADGSVPFVVPDVLRQMDTAGLKGNPDYVGGDRKIPAGGAAGWADAAVTIPWAMYVAYGDSRILERQYESMSRWVDYERRRAGSGLIWKGDFQFGDWLDFGSASRNRFGATSTNLIATAYFAHSVDLLSQTASVLGRRDDAERYAKLFADICAAFQRAFVSADGVVGKGSQTAHVLALQFHLLRNDQRVAAAEHLAEEVRREGHLTTGFLGTPGLLFALSDNDHLEEAFQLLNRKEYPSWLYPLGHGATTIWERWDGIEPDGSFETATMNSFNHYAYGAVGEWLYRVIAGISPDPTAPGYRHVFIQPRVGGGLAHVEASHTGPLGTVRSGWRVTGGKLTLDVEIPPNSTATVRLPHCHLADVTEGGASLAKTQGVMATQQADRDVLVEIGSGRFEFECSWAQ